MKTNINRSIIRSFIICIIVGSLVSSCVPLIIYSNLHKTRIPAQKFPEISLTDDQKNLFLSVKTVRFILDEDFPKTAGVTFPVLKETEKVFNYAGITGYHKLDANADATLHIFCRGIALSGEYNIVRDPRYESFNLYKGANETYHLYTGAKISGKYIYQVNGVSPYKSKFEGVIYPPKTVKNLPSTPSGAPFKETSQKCTYLRDLFILIGSLYGDGALSAALKDDNPIIRLACIQAIPFLNDSGLVYLCQRMLYDADPDVKGYAALGLAYFNINQSIEVLINNAGNPNPDIRLEIAYALGRTRDYDAIQTLILLLDDEKDIVRNAALTSLGTLTNKKIGTHPNDWKLWWKNNKEFYINE